jgi:Resolvase, N terminal domain
VRDYTVKRFLPVSARHQDRGTERKAGELLTDRPALQEALSRCTKGALVVYSLSRLARSTKDTLEIADRLAGAGADLVSLSERIDTTTASGKMVFRTLAVLAEFERDQVSERTRFAMAHKKGNGERVGSVPYGFRFLTTACTAKHGMTDRAPFPWPARYAPKEWHSGRSRRSSLQLAFYLATAATGIRRQCVTWWPHEAHPRRSDVKHHLAPCGCDGRAPRRARCYLDG